jgi:hypothetical protein
MHDFMKLKLASLIKKIRCSSFKCCSLTLYVPVATDTTDHKWNIDSEEEVNI